MLRRLLPPRLARLGCQPLALRPLLALRTLAAKAGKKAERKAGKKAAQALKFTRVLQEEEALAFRSGKVLAGSAQPSPARPSPAQPSTAQHSTAQHSTAQHSTAQHSTRAKGLEDTCTRKCFSACLCCHDVTQVLPHEHDATCALVERAVSSHRAASGRPLIALDGTRRSVARQLWDAPVACVVVGVGAAGGAAGGAEEATLLAAEPTYLYANLLACEAHGAASLTDP